MPSSKLPFSPQSHRHQDGAPSRWDRYVALLERERVPEKARPHYLRFVEAFLRELRPKSLSTLTGDQVTDYFRRIAANGKLANWQFRQTVDAI